MTEVTRNQESPKAGETNSQSIGHPDVIQLSQLFVRLDQNNEELLYYNAGREIHWDETCPPVSEDRPMLRFGPTRFMMIISSRIHMFRLSLACLAAILTANSLPPAGIADDGIRTERLINGPWQFRKVDESGDFTDWDWVTVPSVMQSHEGLDWHGIGEYRRTIDNLKLDDGQRLILHFSAVATHAEVFWNGNRLGEHLGGWTPFRFDVTKFIGQQESKTHELVVKVDERVGHNTQGFLPIVQPHYGGIWQSVKLLTVCENYISDLTLQIPSDTELPIWSPNHPGLKNVAISNGAGDQVTIRTARRKFEVRGDQFFLNDQPLQIRGVLNWGYYPPTLEPNPPEDVWRADLRRIKSWGFNLMKCCLWLPPQRLLEIADEEGVLIWMEYPTWHPQFTTEHLPDLKQEFAEFFAYVRHHPSVILHSLTCETGPGADISVLKELTETCKQMIPGAIVEDDSSWIEWNRITDFYDDHPYGNNHTWVETLHRLRDYRQLGVKPLLLGEAIAADTWTPADALIKRVGSERPYWLPYHLQANIHWLHRLSESDTPIDQDKLIADSKKYALLMRKFQMETFRREVPNGGYVVSVIRDFPLAAMGLLDYSGNEKWSSADWQWHGDSMLVLQTHDDRRSFECGSELSATIHAVGRKPANANLKITIESPDNSNRIVSSTEPQLNGNKWTVRFQLPIADRPSRVVLKATLLDGDDQIAVNAWPLWILPRPREIPDQIIVANKLNTDLLARLEAGGRVLLLPNNSAGSLPLRSHWFLRGAPAVFSHPCLDRIPHDLLVETQHFDLAGDVIPNVQYLNQVDPIVVLWDNHDIREVRTHALAFETNVRKGRLLVSAFNHKGNTNAVGKWLLGEFSHQLLNGPPPSRCLSTDTVAGIRNQLAEKKIELGNLTWKFKPDPQDVGLAQGWAHPSQSTSDWGDIRIDRAWEGQGFPNLDGWAWYHKAVDVPESFENHETFVRFTGVDDYYELFVNGNKVGSGGDIESKTTAFEEVKSYNVTQFVTPGEPVVITVRVYDWYGAGGIFRPVTLTTSPEGSGGENGVAFIK